MIDYATIYASLYNRAATSDDGERLRARLGGASSVFDRSQLGNVANRVFPWLVWVAQPVTGVSGDMRGLAGSWWAYVAKGASTRQLHAIATEVETLYGAGNALALAGGRVAVTFVGQPITDATLGDAQGMEIRILYTERG